VNVFDPASTMIWFGTASEITVTSTQSAHSSSSPSFRSRSAYVPERNSFTQVVCVRKRVGVEPPEMRSVRNPARSKALRVSCRKSSTAFSLSGSVGSSGRQWPG
jgi:hypothetical protein